MFTGIVEELGEVVRLEARGDSARLTVRGPTVAADARHGASISVNGCCLTVVEHDQQTFTVDVMRESLERTSLGALAPGSRVNLERAVTADTRLGGHLVQGHVDGTGTILHREPGDHWEVVSISLPADLARYVAMKGSITVDGVSLTVSGLVDDPTPVFSVSLIPTTLALTTLGHKQPGDAVNLEVDVVAKYVERLLDPKGTVVERLLDAKGTVVERLLDAKGTVERRADTRDPGTHGPPGMGGPGTEQPPAGDPVADRQPVAGPAAHLRTDKDTSA